ncbi:hypothetical protein ACNOYE_18210 [Nannocystaceae bacterium ST9]
MPIRVRVHPEPLAAASVLVDTFLACGREQARELVEAGKLFEVEYLDEATSYRLADEARGKGLRVEFDPRLDARTLAGPREVGEFMVRHRSGKGREVAAAIVEGEPRLGLADASDIIENHGLIQIAISRAEATRIVERLASIGAQADIERIETAWVALPGEPDLDF